MIIPSETNPYKNGIRPYTAKIHFPSRKCVWCDGSPVLFSVFLSVCDCLSRCLISLQAKQAIYSITSSVLHLTWSLHQKNFFQASKCFVSKTMLCKCTVFVWFAIMAYCLQWGIAAIWHHLGAYDSLKLCVVKLFVWYLGLGDTLLYC